MTYKSGKITSLIARCVNHQQKRSYMHFCYLGVLNKSYVQLSLITDNVFPGKESEIEVSKYKKRKLREQAEVVLLTKGCWFLTFNTINLSNYYGKH